MMDFFKKLLGIETAPSVNYAELLKQGAIILDVRTSGEYANGHIKGSINISVDQLANNLAKLKDKNKPIITCCASGMRSSSAKKLLETQGYTQVFNGGSWASLQNNL